jgi:hypothetical protein
MYTKTRCSYNKNGDKSVKDVWVTSMLLDNDRKIANKAMLTALGIGYATWQKNKVVLKIALLLSLRRISSTSTKTLLWLLQ